MLLAKFLKKRKGCLNTIKTPVQLFFWRMMDLNTTQRKILNAGNVLHHLPLPEHERMVTKGGGMWREGGEGADKGIFSQTSGSPELPMGTYPVYKYQSQNMKQQSNIISTNSLIIINTKQIA
jgi:hypothetical protein